MGLLTEKNSTKKNMLLTLVMWCVLCGGCMTAMLAVAADKTIVIADAAAELSVLAKEKTQEDSRLTGGKEQTDAVPGIALDIQQEASLQNQLCIPLEKGIRADQVTMENRYTEQELWIYIKNAEETFYQQNSITGDSSYIGQCWYEVKEDGLLIKMQMKGVWEYHSTMENDSLKIALSNPRESFQQIVVLDPVGTGREIGLAADDPAAMDLTLQVARLVQKKVSQPDIRIYLTHSEDGTVSEELKKRLIQEVEPDLFLQIGVLEDEENSEQYGIAAYYNEEYYIPDFGNVEWADIVTKKVTVAASNRALGLFPAEEDSFLKQLDVPAAEICLGYLTNAQENALLSRESYQEKLAEGIAEAILEVYTNTDTPK